MIWAVYTNTDLTEGRGRQYAKHFCELKSTAMRMAKGGYVQGCDCPVEAVEVLVLDGKKVLPSSLIRIEPPTAEDQAAEKRMEIRASAIARAKEAGITDDEIAIIAAS